MTEGKSDFLHANGLRHHVLSYGDGSAPPLIILPGITSPAVTAEFLALHLAARFRVYVPDLRGRGETEVAEAGRYTLADYADDVSGLLTALGLLRPVLLGHSLGARIAAAYRVRHDAADTPLVLVDPPLSGPGRDPYPTGRDAFVAQLDEAVRGTTAEEVRRYYPKWPRRELELRARVLASCDRTAVLETHKGFHEEDFFEYWCRIDGNAALIRGADSPVVTENGERELRETNPRIPIETVESAGHMVPWDNVEGFNAAVDNALAEMND